MSEERKPFWAKCKACGHCWAAAYIPMEVSAFARTVMGCRCPMCGASKPLIAKQTDGSLQEEGAAG